MHLLVLSAFRHGLRAHTRLSQRVSMHLLVLSAFRRAESDNYDEAIVDHLSQCTFWCSVLSDDNGKIIGCRGFSQSQCTFWCSVLSDNGERRPKVQEALAVSMHLLVLSAFRQGDQVTDLTVPALSQCTFWCSVLSDLLLSAAARDPLYVSQCTFWCSVLSDLKHSPTGGFSLRSQCTFWCSVLSDPHRGLRRGFSPLRLNAPSGAQCFPTGLAAVLGIVDGLVSMHLLVLSAFRHEQQCVTKSTTVSMHLLVLSAFRRGRNG